jgi:hypothetical protein
MSNTRRLQIERLEGRELLSASRTPSKLEQIKLEQSPAAFLQSAVVSSIASYDGVKIPLASDAQVQQITRSVAPSPQTTRWDKVVLGTWYVPPGNMLAYLVGPAGVDPLAVADQTIFNITSAKRGAFSGTGSVTLAIPGAGTSTTDFTIQGVVTPAGQIRIHFTPTNPQDAAITGLGNMELINGSWRMTMQVASAGSVKLFHWANMTKLPTGESPPSPVIDPGGTAGQWKWLLHTRWLLDDSSGISGKFEIDTYRKGYFFGRGLGKSDFRVVASVTPEGSLLMLLISSDGTVNRTGTLKRAGQSGLMEFRSYQGTAGVGAAVLLSAKGIKVPHIQLLPVGG